MAKGNAKNHRSEAAIVMPKLILEVHDVGFVEPTRKASTMDSHCSCIARALRLSDQSASISRLIIKHWGVILDVGEQEH